MLKVLLSQQIPKQQMILFYSRLSRSGGINGCQQGTENLLLTRKVAGVEGEGKPK
jgi:hypothetical protein